MASFPLRSFLELGAYETAPGSARGHARNVLSEWGLGAFEEKAILVVSEIVTNSVAATGKVQWETELPHTPSVRLWLLAGPDGVLVAVWDAVTSLPEPREAGELDESGRGLQIVEQFSARWDCYLPPAPHGGKVTRALITSPVMLVLIEDIRWEGNEMPARQCECGFTEGEAADQTLFDHLLEAFVPEGDKGTDGLVHLEGEPNLTCLCGFAAATAEDLDAHFVAVFTPADAIGRDGKKHHPIAANDG